ncbi:hypothetical protein ACFL2K_02575 [Candidatus Margulisiibacteriota bacterium]
MKKISLILLMLLIPSLLFAIPKNELKNALKDLSWDDCFEIMQEVEKKANLSALTTGYVKNIPFGGAGGLMLVFPSAISNNFPAGLDKLSTLYGGAGGFIYSLDKNWGIGGLFGGFGGASTKKIGANYTSFSTGAAFQHVCLKYKTIIDPQFIIDIDLGIGLLEGGYAYKVTDETAYSTNVSRSGLGLSYLLGINLRYRFDATWFMGTKLGYFNGQLNKITRADFTDSGNTLDFSGVYFAMTMGGNF